jgi:hypothetical protein
MVSVRHEGAVMGLAGRVAESRLCRNGVESKPSGPIFRAGELRRHTPFFPFFPFIPSFAWLLYSTKSMDIVILPQSRLYPGLIAPFFSILRKIYASAFPSTTYTKNRLLPIKLNQG